jgi:hypothetical protein
MVAPDPLPKTTQEPKLDLCLRAPPCKVGTGDASLATEAEDSATEVQGNAFYLRGCFTNHGGRGHDRKSSLFGRFPA